MSNTEAEFEFQHGYLVHGDNLQWMKSQPDDSFDLCFGSPPYEAQRAYGIDFDLKGQDWVDWMVIRWIEMQRITKGLVGMVVEGFVKDRVWSATPVLLMADLHKAGFKLRKPPIYKRFGLPGTGGNDWLANHYEFVVCTSKGKLGGDPTFCGAFRKARSASINNRTKTGDRKKIQTHIPAGRVNPGNVIDCGNVGGKGLGSKKANDNEAPFPEKLSDFFVLSFSNVGDVVLDPFCGSGTTISSAIRHRRKFVGVDVRKSQIDLASKRISESVLRRGFDL